MRTNRITLSDDGKFSWEEVECLGACTNAPMAQIGKDYYEDLTTESFTRLLDELAAGRVPTPGPQNGRFASEPKSGLTSLKEFDSGKKQYNASAQLATDIGDTIKRIDGTEVPLLAPWQDHGANHHPDVPAANVGEAPEPAPAPKAKAKPASKPKAKAAPKPAAPTAVAGTKPKTLKAARDTGPDDLKLIKGVGPKLEKLLHSMGFYHFDQVAAWSSDEVAWVDENLEGFKGRVSRDTWVDQAKILAAGGETEFSSRNNKGPAKS